MTKLKIALIILASVLALCSLTVMPVLAQGTAWEQFHRDDTNSGCTTATTQGSGDIRWFTGDIGAVTSSSPVVANGKVFVYCNDRLRCLDESTGDELWSRLLEASSMSSWSSPAYHLGRVFIASESKVYCFNEEDGTDGWAAPFEIPAGVICNSSVTLAENKVFLGDWTNGIYYCLNEADGAELWHFQRGSEPYGNAYSSPAVAGGRVFFGLAPAWGEDEPQVVYCVSVDESGPIDEDDAIWESDPLDYGVCGSVAVGSDTIYAATYNFGGDGSLYAFNVEDGSIKWQRTIYRTNSTPTLDEVNGRVYVSGGTPGYGALATYCFDADGNELWQMDDIGGWTCSAAVADRVLVGNLKDVWSGAGGYGTCALDPETGDIIWSSLYGGSSPAVAGGVVFTIAQGRVYAFGTPAASLPDLVLTEMELPNYVEDGAANTITTVVKNEGPGMATDLVVTLIADSTVMDTQSIDLLSPAAEEMISLSWTPDIGDYTLKVTVDPDNAIPETDEGNNELTKAVSAPQLRLGLLEEWNFISTSKKLKSGHSTAEQVFGGVDTAGHSIFRYAAPEGWEVMGGAEEVTPLDGIWVYSSGPVEIYLAFDTNPRRVPPSKQLYAGWSTIGFSDMDGTSANSALTSVEAQWAYLIGFEAASQEYDPAIINNDHNGEEHDEGLPMYPGRGYWLYMTADGELAAVGV